MIKLNIHDSVHTLCTAHPDLIPLLQSMGFHDIAKPGMLNTVGRFMTLDKGARMKNIPLEKIRETLREHGFNLQ